LDAFLVQVSDDAGGVGDRKEEPVQFRYDNYRLALFRGREEFAARRTAGERLARAYSRILEHLGEV
jgi:hypothetical protein